jgi:hypothetical protein
MVLIPFAAFAGAFVVGAIMLWFIVKRSKIVQTETQTGKAVHIEMPIGSLEMRPEANLDPRLAEIPVYPGAMRENPLAAQSVTSAHLFSRTFQDISATYWTPDSVKQVWEFYRQQLPDWPRNLVDTQGKELIHDESDCVRLIRVSRRGDRTVIETCIKPPGYPNVY